MNEVPSWIESDQGGESARQNVGSSAVDLSELNESREVTTVLTFGDATMKTFLFVFCAAAIAASSASAQQPAKSGPNNNAVNSSGQNNSNAPVAGRNSFTEGQAKSKIEEAGYTNVTDLKKDDNGVWRGKAAKKGGSAAAVSVDFQGNVNPAR